MPAPGQAPMPAPNAAALLRANATDPERAARPAVRFEDRVWTHAEFVAESCRFAALFLERLTRPRPAPRRRAARQHPRLPVRVRWRGAGRRRRRRPQPHPPRRAPAARRRRTPTAAWSSPSRATSSCSTRSPTGSRRSSPAAASPAATTLTGRSATTSTTRSARSGDDDPGLEPDLDTHLGADLHVGHLRRAQGRHLLAASVPRHREPDGDHHGPRPRRRRLRLHAAVPLERGAWSAGRRRSSSGASVGLGRRFSASRWLPDVRHYGATYFNYTGKPLAYLLATPEQPDDADNPLRVAFGNEGSPEVVDTFARRFGVDVIDAYGATEGGVAVNRDVAEPAGALGQVGRERPGRRRGRPRAAPSPVRRPTGSSLNADECVGEIVNTAGAGPFEGYYNNPAANERTPPQRLVLDRATSATSTPTATCTSRAATPTGSASTARTSPPGPIESAIGA